MLSMSSKTSEYVINFNNDVDVIKVVYVANAVLVINIVYVVNVVNDIIKFCQEHHMAL